MNMRIVAFLIVVLACALCPPVKAQRTSGRGVDSYFTSKRNEDAVLKYLRPALRAGGYVARIYYSGRCQLGSGGSDIGAFVSFPQIHVRPPHNLGVLAVKEMFRGDTDVAVFKEPHKIISISLGHPAMAILRTRVSVLKLARIAQYNPSLVIGAIESAREVRAAMARLRLRVPIVLSAQLIALPAKGLPHLPATMRNVTMDQVLDLVALTFKGIVVYGVCTQTQGGGMYDIDFTGLGGTMK